MESLDQRCRGQGGWCGKPIKGNRTVERRTLNSKTREYETTTNVINMCGIHLRTHDNRIKARENYRLMEINRDRVREWARAKERAFKFLAAEFERGAEDVSFSQVVGFAPGKWGDISNDAELTDGTTLADLMERVGKN